MRKWVSKMEILVRFLVLWMSVKWKEYVKEERQLQAEVLVAF